MAKCEDPQGHKAYPCPNRYGHVVHVEQAEGEPPAAALETAERVLGQDSYCPVCDVCELCNFRTTPAPDPVWQFGIHQEEGRFRLVINEREVGAEEFYDHLGRIPALRPPALVIMDAREHTAGITEALEGLQAGRGMIVTPDTKVEALPFPGGFYDLARRLQETDGAGFVMPGSTAVQVIRSLVGALVTLAGYSWAYLVRDLVRNAPERETTGALKTPEGWAVLFIVFLEAVRRAGITATALVKAAHKAVDTVEAGAVSPRGQSALNARHKVVGEPATGGYLCVPCRSTVRPDLERGVRTLTDWAERRDEFFAEHGRPRI